MSHWAATVRYGLTPAPSGLALVQDLINTRAIGEYGPDLLRDGAAATEWAAQAVAAHSAPAGPGAPSLRLTDGDAAKLRELRATLAGLVVGADDGGDLVAHGGARFAVSPTGQVHLVPGGRGWRWLSSAVWAEVLHAQWTGGWPRLKVCRNPDCASSFYDRSKNNSGVWHDVKTCGNAANLRASRARRRTAST